MKVPRVLKNDEHMKAHENKKNLAMSQIQKARKRDLIQQRSINSTKNIPHTSIVLI
jgi:tRNA G37 N-methylase TrmD